MLKILVADDEATICEIVALYLKKAGFAVFVASDGEQALAIEMKEEPDLLILDVMLPKYTGLELCRMIKREVPRIFLTALSSENDKINGFSIGADDYITKPFSPRELVARVKAVLRRAGLADAPLSSGALSLDIANQSAVLDGAPISLTPKECDLLKFFLQNKSRTFSREQLLTNIWGYDYAGDERAVDTTIKRLRQKLASEKFSYIHTVRGCGYKFEVQPK
jgi:two-component system response regulator ResD